MKPELAASYVGQSTDTELLILTLRESMHCRNELPVVIEETPMQIMTRLAGKAPSWLHESKLPLWLIKAFEEKNRRLAAESAAAAAQQALRGEGWRTSIELCK